MPAPLRFAVIGCGAIAQARHLPNLTRSSKAMLQVCVDLDAATLDHCRVRYQPTRVTDDPLAAINDPTVDAICLAIAGPRLPLIRAAAAAGKPVYVEKPLGLTLDETFEIQAVVRQAGIKVCVGHNRRSSPAMRDAHRIFRAHMAQPNQCRWRWDRDPAARPSQPDDTTAVMSIRINDDWYSWKHWIFDSSVTTHGVILCELTHFTDLCNWFLDSSPREVVALHSGALNTAVTIRYTTGELATITMAGNGTFGYPKELYEVMGNGGIVVVDHLAEVRTAGIAEAPVRQIYPLQDDRHPSIGGDGGISGWLAKKQAACIEAERAGDPLLQFTAEPDKGHAHAFDGFVDEIRGTGPVVCGVDDAVLATRVAFAAIRSTQERRIVALAEIFSPSAPTAPSPSQLAGGVSAGLFS